MADYWEIAVAVEFENPHFRHTNRFSGYGDWLNSSALTSISLETDAGETNLTNILSPSRFTEKISIKNSSGQVVNKTINSIDEDNALITLSSDLSSEFNQSDLEIFGYGKNIPGGWYCGSSGAVDRIIGYTDNFGIKLTSQHSVKQSIDSEFDFSANCGYRIFGVGSSGVGINVTGESSDSYHLDFGSGSYESSGKSISTALDDVIQIYSNGGVISDIGLEFAYNPLVDKEISSGGYYQFPTYADENSVSWSVNDASVFGNRNNQSVWQYDPTGQGERNEKITLTASFSKVPLSFYKKLREFERIQKNGFYLNLHPYGYDELPDIITGKIKLSNKNISRSMWNLDRVDFDIEFMQK